MFKCRFVLIVAMVAGLAACGGGGGNGGGSNNGGGNQGQGQDRFTAAVQSVVSSLSDDTEPQTIDGVESVEADAAEPVATG